MTLSPVWILFAIGVILFALYVIEAITHEDYNRWD